MGVKSYELRVDSCEKSVIFAPENKTNTMTVNHTNKEAAGNICSEKDIAKLREAVERALGRTLHTPKDFEQLSAAIQSRLGVMISRNTLRRLWGTMQDVGQPRRSTLDYVVRFLGYTDMDAFIAQAGKEITDTSNPVMSRKIHVGTELRKGDRLRLTWLPDRVCDVEYNGSLHFCIIDSKNTRLKAGDTFLCGLIIEGEPLYLDEWQHENEPAVSYVCGKRGGVRFERI